MTDEPNGPKIDQTTDGAQQATQFGYVEGQVSVHHHYYADGSPKEPLPESARPLIFIAYAGSDGRAYAQQIEQDLRQEFEFRTWWDYKQLPGDDWWAAIQRAIDEADAVVVIMTAGALTARWVREEYLYSLKQRKPVIPVQVREDFGPNDARADIAALHWVNVSGNRYRTGMRQLVDALPNLHLKAAQKRPSRGRGLWAIGAAIVAVLAVVVALIAMGSGNGGGDSTLVVGGGGSDTPTIDPVVAANQILTSTHVAGRTQTAESWTDTPTPDMTETIGAILTFYAEETSAAVASLTAIHWTDTPTPTSIFTPAAVGMIHTETLARTIVVSSNTLTPDMTETVVAVLTLTATHWIDTPTPTHTPTATYTPSDTPTTTATSTATQTPSNTSTPTTTNTPIPLGYPGNPVTRNDDWTPVMQEFDDVEMVLVPAGCFMMGSEDGEGDEQPVHQQCFGEPFWIDRFEVTNGQYGSFGSWAGDNRPREEVTWFEARDYCWIRGARLLTEAEWEYAARGPDSLVYPWGDEFVAEYVVYLDNSGDVNANVGGRLEGASWVGALDLSGNVWEWTNTIYEDYPYSADDGREDNSNSSSARVLRGGSFSNTADGLYAANRFGNNPDSENFNRGFRCACDY